MGPKKPKRRDPLLDLADALDAGKLTHEQLVALNTPERIAEGYRQDTDLGPVAAFGLGAAHGMSMGLGDVAQRLINTQADQQAIAATGTEHPTATTLGTVTGAALPFLLAGRATGVPLTAGKGALIAGAQGLGLTPGNVGNRLIGGATSAATALAAPFLARGAAGVASRIPIIGSLMRVGGRVAAKVPISTPAAEALGTPEELAVAKQLGIPLKQVQGRVGTPQAASLLDATPRIPAARAAGPDLLETPTYLRRGANAPGLLTPATDETDNLLQSLKASRIGAQPGVPTAPGDLLGPEAASGLLPQDFYAESSDLAQMLRMGHMTPEYGQAIRAELARRLAQKAAAASLSPSAGLLTP